MAFFFVLFVLVAFALGILARPVAVIAFAIAIFAFEQWAQANASFFGSHSSFLNLAMGVLTIWALINVVLRGDNPLNPVPPSFIVFWALFVFAAASCIWSLDRELSLFLFQYNAPYMLIVAIAMPMLLQKQRDMGDAFVISLFFGTIVMLLLLTGTQLHAYGRTISADVTNRFGQSNDRLSPLAIADMAGELLIISLLMNFKGRRRIWKTARWGIAFLAVALIVRSGSRGQFIAAFLIILSCVMISRGGKNIVGFIAGGISVAVVTVAAALGYSAASEGEFGKRWSLEYMSNNFADTRLGFTQQLLTYWAESSPMNWFVGLGSSSSFDPRVIGTYCHVVMIEVLGELGLVGFTMMCAFLILVARDGVRLYFLTIDDDEERGVATTVIALFLFHFILTFKQGSYLTHTLAWCFGMMISRQCAIVQKSAAQSKTQAKKRQWFAYQRWLHQTGQLPPSGTQPAN